jgi:hypothetical protein
VVQIPLFFSVSQVLRFSHNMDPGLLIVSQDPSANSNLEQGSHLPITSASVNFRLAKSARVTQDLLYGLPQSDLDMSVFRFK